MSPGSCVAPEGVPWPGCRVGPGWSCPLAYPALCPRQPRPRPQALMEGSTGVSQAFWLPTKGPCKDSRELIS